MSYTLPAGAAAPAETIAHAHVRYEIYRLDDGSCGDASVLVGYRHERAYVIARGGADLCHDTATHLIGFGGYPLIERCHGIPEAVRAAVAERMREPALAGQR